MQGIQPKDVPLELCIRRIIWKILGMHYSQKGHRSRLANAKTILDMELPKKIEQLESFLGTVSYIAGSSQR